MIRVLRRIRDKLMPASDATPSDWQVEQGASYYDEQYRSDDHPWAYHESHYYFLWTVIADRLRRARVQSVLEVGCGAGRLAELLLDQGVCDYVGLDFSSTAIDLARKRLPGIRFEIDDARRSKLYEQLAHDALVCTEVLEHIQDDLGVIARFQPGVRCLCSVPNFPYPSHVRYFADSQAVVSRYARFFEGFDVATFRSPVSKVDRFFLFEGIRNEAVA